MFFTKFGGAGTSKTSQRVVGILQRHTNGEAVEEEEVLWVIQQVDFLSEFERGDKAAVSFFGRHLPLLFESALSRCYECATESNDDATPRGMPTEASPFATPSFIFEGGASGAFKSRSDQSVSCDELTAANATILAPTVGSRQSKLVDAARSSIRLLCGRAPETPRRLESFDTNVRSVWGNLWLGNSCRSVVADFFSSALSVDALTQIANAVGAAARPLEEERSRGSEAQLLVPPPLHDGQWMERLLSVLRLVDALAVLAGDVLVDGLPSVLNCSAAVEGARRVFERTTSLLWDLVELCCKVYDPVKQAQLESWYTAQIYVTQDQSVAVDWLHEAYEAAALCCVEISGTFQSLICRSPLTATAVAAQVADRIPNHRGARRSDADDKEDHSTDCHNRVELTSAGAMLPRIFSLTFLSRFPLASLGAESLYQFLNELLFVCLPARSLTVADLTSQWFSRDALNRWDLPPHTHGLGIMLHLAGLQDSLPSKDPYEDQEHDWGQVLAVPPRCDDDDSPVTRVPVVHHASSAPLSPPPPSTPSERRRTTWRYTSLLLSIAKAHVRTAEPSQRTLHSGSPQRLLRAQRATAGVSGSSLLLRGVQFREGETLQRLQRLRLWVRFLDSAQYVPEAAVKKGTEGISREDLAALPRCAEALVSLNSDWCRALSTTGAPSSPICAEVAVTSATVNCLSLLLIELLTVAVRTSLVEVLCARPHGASRALKMTVDWLFNLVDCSGTAGLSRDENAPCGCWLSSFSAALTSAAHHELYGVLVEGQVTLVASLEIALHAALRWRHGECETVDSSAVTTAELGIGVATTVTQREVREPLWSTLGCSRTSSACGLTLGRVTTMSEASDLLVELSVIRSLLLGCGSGSSPPAAIHVRLAEYVASVGGDVAAHRAAIPPASPFSPRTPASSSAAALTFDAILANSPGRQKLALLLPGDRHRPVAAGGNAETQTFGDVDLFLSWDGEGEEVPSFESATTRTRHRRVLSHPHAVSPSEHETVGGAFDLVAMAPLTIDNTAPFNNRRK